MRLTVCENNQAPLAPPAGDELDRTGVRRERPGSCTRSNFQAKSALFSILPTAALIIHTNTLKEVQKHSLNSHLVFGGENSFHVLLGYHHI